MELSKNSIDTRHSTLQKNVFVSGYSITVGHGTEKTQSVLDPG